MKHLKLFENQNNDRLFTKDDFYCIMDSFQDLIDEWCIEFDDRILGQPRIGFANSLRYYFNFPTLGNILNPIKGNNLTVNDCHNINLAICYPKAYFFKLSNDLTKYEQFKKELNDFIKLINDINPTWEIIKKENFATDSAMIVIKFKKNRDTAILRKHLKKFNESNQLDIQQAIKDILLDLNDEFNCHIYQSSKNKIFISIEKNDIESNQVNFTFEDFKRVIGDLKMVISYIPTISDYGNPGFITYYKDTTYGKSNTMILHNIDSIKLEIDGLTLYSILMSLTSL